MEKTALLITGMHRSGTSLVAGLTRIHGVDLGNDLMPANETNPKGFFEPNEIVGIHDRMLHALGRRWDDIRTLPDAWWRSSLINSYKTELINQFEKNYTGAIRGIKDPRLCRLLPLWLGLLDNLGWAPKILLVIRRPEAVACSLYARDGIERELGHALWAQYHAEFAAAIPANVPVAVIANDEVHADTTRAISRIARQLELRLTQHAEQSAATQDFVDPALRRHDPGHDYGSQPQIIQTAALYEMIVRHTNDANGVAESISQMMPDCTNALWWPRAIEQGMTREVDRISVECEKYRKQNEQLRSDMENHARCDINEVMSESVRNLATQLTGCLAGDLQGIREDLRVSRDLARFNADRLHDELRSSSNKAEHLLTCANEFQNTSLAGSLQSIREDLQSSRNLVTLNADRIHGELRSSSDKVEQLLMYANEFEKNLRDHLSALWKSAELSNAANFARYMERQQKVQLDLADMVNKNLAEMESRQENGVQRYNVLHDHITKSLTMQVDAMHELRDVVAKQHADISELRLQTVKLQADEEILQSELDAAKKYIHELHRSRSWRLTAPLRNAVSILRRQGRSRALPHDAEIAKDESRVIATPARSNPEHAPVQSVFFSIDSLHVSEQMVYFDGWLLSASERIRQVELRIRCGDDVLSTTVAVDRDSPDVQQAHPAIEGAAQCRFVGTLTLSAIMHGAILSGQTPLLSLIYRQGVDSITVDFSGESYLAYLKGEEENWRLLRASLSDTRAAHLVIDHDLGGGSNRVRKRDINRISQIGDLIILTTFHPHRGYWCQVLGSSQPIVFQFASIKSLIHALDGIQLESIIINDVVSYPDLPGILQSVLALLPDAVTRLILPVHDYFMACPCWYLIDAEGRFCGVPDSEHCFSCMKKTNGSFLSLAPRVMPAQWRQMWKPLLQRANEVLCYSESSVNLLCRAYPELPAEKIVVRPHDDVFVGPNKINHVSRNQRGRWTVAAVGHISYIKGAEIIAEMNAMVQKSGTPIDFIVIGSAADQLASSGIMQTGPYLPEDLLKIMQENEVAAVILPMISPETFSYVAHEVCTLGIPAVGFDLGAVGECLRGYPRGLLAREVSAAAMLEAVCIALATFAGYPWAISQGKSEVRSA